MLHQMLSRCTKIGQEHKVNRSCIHNVASHVSTCHDNSLWLFSVGVSTDSPIDVTPLKAVVRIAALSPVVGGGPSSLGEARLTAGTTGRADAFGLIMVPDLVVSAVPGLYNLSVTLTDFPLVRRSGICLHGTVVIRLLMTDNIVAFCLLVMLLICGLSRTCLLQMKQCL